MCSTSKYLCTFCRLHNPCLSMCNMAHLVLVLYLTNMVLVVTVAVAVAVCFSGEDICNSLQNKG